MGFFDELADMAEYMMFGNRSRSAARMRANRADLDQQARDAYAREQATGRGKPQSGERTTVQRSGGSRPPRRMPPESGSSQSSGSSDRWELQDESPDAKVFVHGGFTRDPSRPDYNGRTDIRIVDKTGDEVSRIHKSYDAEDGTESTW